MKMKPAAKKPMKPMMKPKSMKGMSHMQRVTHEAMEREARGK
jgi:hypothetical protein